MCCICVYALVLPPLPRRLITASVVPAGLLPCRSSLFPFVLVGDGLLGLRAARQIFWRGRRCPLQKDVQTEMEQRRGRGVIVPAATAVVVQRVVDGQGPYLGPQREFFSPSPPHCIVTYIFTRTFPCCMSPQLHDRMQRYNELVPLAKRTISLAREGPYVRYEPISNIRSSIILQMKGIDASKKELHASKFLVYVGQRYLKETFSFLY